jgi:hypothetical protein
MQEVTLVYVVTVQLARQSGPFAPLEDLAQEVQDALENADPGDIEAGDSYYAATSWDVARQEQPRSARLVPAIKRVRSAQDKLAGRP